MKPLKYSEGPPERALHLATEVTRGISAPYPFRTQAASISGV
ncbi:MAG: hypothetical protein QOG45_2735 [Chloroflexota bacterium]|nr:hypothetical protein [Chloroflexota bacterium]